MVSNILHDRIYSQKQSQSLNKAEKYADARHLRGFFADGAAFVQSSTVSVANQYSIPVPMLATGLKVCTAGIGVLGAPLGLYIMRNACKNGARAIACGDGEGASLHGLQGVMGLGSAATGGLAGADAILDLAGMATPKIVTGLFTGFGFGMYGALGLYGLYSRSVAKDFAKTLGKQRQAGSQQAIRWLYEQNSLSPAEIEKIHRIAKHPDRVIARSLQKKWNAFDLRTSAECGKEIRGQLQSLVQNYNSVGAERVIEVVEKANCKARVKSTIFILIALVGIVAFAVLLCLSGPAAPALFAAVALLSVTLDSEKVQNYITEKCWKWHLK